MTDKERERIKQKYLNSDKHKRHMRRYAKKVAKMTPDEQLAEQAKQKRILAKYEDAEWIRKRSLRFAGGVILSFFVVVYAVLWLVGVSIHSIWGFGVILLVTLVFLALIASFMDVYRNGGEDSES